MAHFIPSLSLCHPGCNRLFLLPFPEALELEDVAVVSDIIEETNNPWAKELMTKIKNDSFLSDELDLT